MKEKKKKKTDTGLQRIETIHNLKKDYGIAIHSACPSKIQFEFTACKVLLSM